MDLGIEGRWALVCGASKGLGFGCAQALVREGAHVVLVARGQEALDEAVAQLKDDAQRPAAAQVIGVAADVTSREGLAHVLGQGFDFDIVVTNAGGPPNGDFRDWDRQDWINALEANMLAPIELIKATVDRMAGRGFGRIVNITSNAVKAPIAQLGLSNGARSGLTGFVAGVARSDIAGRGVTINNLLPGRFETPRLVGNLVAAARKNGVGVDALRESQVRTIPAGRFGTREEFGAICAFLCSVQAGYITGQNILADGGTFPGTL